MYFMYIELTFKLVADHPIAQPIDRSTDIVKYRATIAAKEYVYGCPAHISITMPL